MSVPIYESGDRVLRISRIAGNAERGPRIQVTVGNDWIWLTPDAAGDVVATLADHLAVHSAKPIPPPRDHAGPPVPMYPGEVPATEVPACMMCGWHRHHYKLCMSRPCPVARTHWGRRADD